MDVKKQKLARRLHAFLRELEVKTTDGTEPVPSEVHTVISDISVHNPDIVISYGFGKNNELTVYAIEQIAFKKYGLIEVHENYIRFSIAKEKGSGLNVIKITDEKEHSNWGVNP